MPDRSFDPPTGDDEDAWPKRRDDLVAQIRATPNASRELQRFATALAEIADPSDIERAFAWLERKGGAAGR